MIDLDDRRAFPVELLEQVHDGLALAGVEVAGGLVGQEELGVGDDGPRDADQLLLPAGELAGEQVLLAHDAEAVQRVADHRRPLGRLDVPIGERHIQVLVDRQRVEQVEALKHEADVLLIQRQPLFGLELVDRLIEEVVLAAPITIQHPEDIQQRGLARRRRPHDSDKLAFLDLQRNLPQDIILARTRFVALLDVAQLDHEQDSSKCCGM